MPVLTAHGLTKIYGSPKEITPTRALCGLNLEVETQEFVGVMGPSGSGKTTLLNILATIDTPTSGSIRINGVSPAELHGDELALFRRRKLGFVFQDFNLLNTLSVRDNIALPLALDNVKAKEIDRRVGEVAARLGITHILDKRTYEISGGEQQRAAIARGIVHRPAILLADEPTGNLDPETAWEIMKVLTDINNRGTTVLMATHAKDIVDEMRKRVIAIENGVLIRDEEKGGYGREIQTN